MPEIGGPSSRALAVDSTRLDSTRVCNDSFAITTRAFVFFSRNPLLPYEYIANNGYIRYLTKFGGAESLDDMLATKPSEKYHTTAHSRSRAEEHEGRVCYVRKGYQIVCIEIRDGLIFTKRASFRAGETEN